MILQPNVLKKKSSDMNRVSWTAEEIRNEHYRKNWENNKLKSTLSI